MGSFLYHASASASLRVLDVGAMYWLFGLAAAYCATIVQPTARRLVAPHAGAVAGATLLAGIVLTASRNVTLAGFKPLSLTVATGLGAAVLLLTLADTARRRESVSGALQLLGIVTLFGVAVYLQICDRPGGRLYRPGAWVQAHALWHVLAAVTFAWTIRVLDRASPSAAEARAASPAAA